jgi:hypothetical protein
MLPLPSDLFLCSLCGILRWDFVREHLKISVDDAKSLCGSHFSFCFAFDIHYEKVTV